MTRASPDLARLGFNPVGILKSSSLIAKLGLNRSNIAESSLRCTGSCTNIPRSSPILAEVSNPNHDFIGVLNFCYQIATVCFISE
ncbi:hypothetical protein L484_016220 [Morus notabilis]|uniref:Uncharacterized protein n=1 Tax=Morus notabilis TaxID=981085 RepID=W9S2D1_9ROSA|nr:hypothetical protein L484_016220 [Morus notabilis]